MAPATEKSAGAFRTISEVSAELDLPQHVLRFWETKFQAIRPLKRGGGRRYYRPEDLDLLRRIRALLYDDGYTIKGVQKLLRQSGLPEAAHAAPFATLVGLLKYVVDAPLEAGETRGPRHAMQPGKGKWSRLSHWLKENF